MAGTEFGRYRLERLIGSGGMGDVYEAFDSERDRVVALKLLPELFSGNEEFLARFRRESRVAARLRDPHIIPIHDFGEIDGRLFIDMRLVDDGATIADLLRDEGALPPERAVRIIGQVAEALDAAHDDGLIHRDIKPTNVLVAGRDFVYVVDFGIAHAIGHTASGLTMSGSTVGTLDYMAPERFSTRVFDRRTDVYSLACLFHQCLTARTPFPGTDLPSLMYAHLNLDPPVPSETDPAIPTKLDAVIARGMAKDPDDRFPTAGALAEAARAAVGAVPAAPNKADRRNGVPTPAPPTMPDPERTAVVRTPTAETEAGRPFVGTPTVVAAPPPSQPPPPPEALPDDGSSPARSPRRLLLVGAAVVAVIAVVVGVVVATRPASASRASVAPAPPAAVFPASLAAPVVTGAVPTPPTPGFVAVSSDGHTGYVANRDPRAVTIMDLTAGSVVGSIPMPSPPRFVTLSQDGSRAFVSCYTDQDTDNAVVVVDTATRAMVATVPVDKRPFSPKLAPDLQTLWVPSHDTATVDVISLASNTVTQRIATQPNPHWVTFANGRAWVVDHESNLVSVYALDGTPKGTIPVGRSPHAAAASPDKHRLAVVDFDGDDVTLIDTTTDQVVGTVPVGHQPQDVVYAPDGRHFYTVDDGGNTITTVDVATGKATSTIPVCGSPTSMAISGRQAWVSCLDDARLQTLTIA
ncbi:protein kinase domain-containing protein [Actinomycetospora chiangmaiensis]|uniref:protein kinase domain-containing protein n=1 Tax=Actinomycetospora chiangmaiensis TaxID=402650 RepID=UPI000684A70E|nr:protein kinase [Actinomycetospora chiangmaiensis]